jgi:uncharacterized membrane protein YdbT with pleckstrin-like domain
MRLLGSGSLSQTPHGTIKIKPSVVPFVWKGAILILLGLVLYVGVFAFSLPFSLSQIPFQLVAFGLVGVGALAALIGLVNRNTFTYLITDQAVIVQRQLLRRNVRRIPFTSISDMEVEQSFVGRILGYGDIAPVTKSGYGLVRGMDRSENMVAEMTNVPNPDHVADLILSRVSGAPKPTVAQ